MENLCALNQRKAKQINTNKYIDVSKKVREPCESE